MVKVFSPPDCSCRRRSISSSKPIVIISVAFSQVLVFQNPFFLRSSSSRAFSIFSVSVSNIFAPSATKKPIDLSISYAVFQHALRMGRQIDRMDVIGRSCVHNERRGHCLYSCHRNHECEFSNRTDIASRRCGRSSAELEPTEWLRLHTSPSWP